MSGDEGEEPVSLVPHGLDVHEANSAYQDGLRNGRLDVLLGYRSEYAWFGVNSLNAYTRSYAHGYKQGWAVAVRKYRETA